jgi:anti-sigma B factor antagonist
MTVLDTAATDLRCSRYDVAGITVIRVIGEIDLHSVPVLRDELFAAAGHGRPRLVVDLSGVDFMDCTGLGVLVAGLRRARERGGGLWLVISSSVTVVRKVLRITRLDAVLPIHRTVAEALDRSAQENR